MNLIQLTCACLCIAGVFANPLLVEEFNLEADNETTVIPPITEATMETTSTNPPTIEPFTTGSTVTPVTIVTVTTPSSAPPSSNTPASLSTIAPTPAPPEKETGFDGGSFGGGIGTGLGICIILFVAYKCYVMRRQGKGYSTM